VEAFLSPSPILALALALVMILGGNMLEGGTIGAIVQPTAAMIVAGGCAGATWLASSDADLKAMFKLLPRLIRPGGTDRRALLDLLIRVAGVVRKDGMLAVEGILGEVDDPFLNRGLRALVDGLPPEDVHRMLELEVDLEEQRATGGAKVLESAGGYAPTIGIIGAVFGLIHVMHNLADPSKLGEGIAVAFVATIYGVGLANVLFLPLANRLKKVIGDDTQRKEMVLVGLDVIAHGANMRQVEETLLVYMPDARKAAA
jgi:chemotaxis protein MotA